jgi:hypothetical protein
MSGVGMRIDIDKLTEAELIDLNKQNRSRLQFLAQMRAHAQMLEFQDRRSRFLSAGRAPVRRGHADSLQSEDRNGHHRRWPALERLAKVLGRADGPHGSSNPETNIVALQKT